MRTNTAVAERTRTAVALNPRLLSLRETMVLAGITEKEKEIRNDIARGVLPSGSVIRIDNSHLCFHLPYVPTFAAIYGNQWLEGMELRRVAFERVFVVASGGNVLPHGFTAVAVEAWNTLQATCDHAARVDIDHYVTINLGKACEDVKPRIGIYVAGLARVEEKDSILGGAAVFRGTRISVAHIGKMAVCGESTKNILEDYPGLTEADVEFAKLYYRARPPVGRPSTSGVAKNAEPKIG